MSFILTKGEITVISDEQFQLVMDKHTEHLFRIAYYYTKNVHVSQDIVQDTFVKFYTTKDYEHRGELKAFLSRITINLCKDYLKSWAYRKMIMQEKLFPQRVVKQEDTLLLKDERDLLDEAILSLPLKQREAIVYYYLEEMTTREIAALLNLSENTVKSRVRSGKKLLKEKLADVEWEVLIDVSI